MAQLKDLIVYGDAKFLGDVTLDHDPTAALHAATKAYVDSQVGTGTDEKLKVAALTSGTEYLPILAVSSDSGAAATRQIDKNAQALKYICTPGTSGSASKGTARLILGNSLSEGYANSAAGQLTIYGNTMYGVTLKYGAAFPDQTLILPAPTDDTQTNYLLSKIGSGAVGAADQPIYINSLGHATAANKNPWNYSTSGGIYTPHNAAWGNNIVYGMIAATYNDTKIRETANVIKSNITQVQSSLYLASATTWGLSSSHAAGSTTYTLSANSVQGDGTLPQITTDQVFYIEPSVGAQHPTSVTISSTHAVLTFSTSLNPTAVSSSISGGIIVQNPVTSGVSNGPNLVIGSTIMTGATESIVVGSMLNVTDGGRNLVVAQNGYSSNGPTLMVGARLKNTNKFTTLIGDTLVTSVKYAALFGVGHLATTGPEAVFATGKYSSIDSTTLFAVGNGTSASARANAFEVHTDGRATVGADPTANLDVATKQYVDGLISTWKLTSQGGLISQPDVIAGDTVGRGVVVIASRSTLQSSMIPELWKSSTDVGSNLMIPAPNYIDLNASAPAGSTTYTIRTLPRTPDGTANHLLDILFGIDSNVSAQKPTSISFDSNGFPILTFATSLNPNEAASRIYAGVELTEDTDASITVGNGVFNSGMSTVITGTLIKNTNNYCIATGQNINNSGAIVLVNGARAKNTGSYVLLSGSDLLNTSSNYSALIGQGHYNTSGPAALAAVGKYSSITSTTQFVVGNGTSASARSNAFEVTTTGEAKAVSFTENGTSLVDKYAVKTHTHGDLSSTGIITTNPGVVIASGDALLIADSSVGNALKKTSITFGTSTTTYLRNDGTWGTPPASSDTKVTQTAVTGTGTTSRYPILLTYSASQTATATNTANFTANASITPAGDIYGSTFHYGANAYTQYNSTLKAIEFCFA